VVACTAAAAAVFVITEAVTPLRPGWLRIVAMMLLSLFLLWRFTELITAAIRITVLWRTEPRETVASFARSAILGIINYIELAVLFAIIYAAFLPHKDWMEPLHRSAQIQFTVALPDSLRPVTWLHAMLSLLFLLALISPILALWVIGRQEEGA
jgi:hypothetical protein